MDKLNKGKEIFIIFIYAVLCISFLYIVLNSSPIFLIHNSFIIAIPFCLFILIIFELITFFIKRKKSYKRTTQLLIRIIVSTILCTSIIASYLYNKTDPINNDNANNYIKSHINMNDFIDTDSIFIYTSGESYNSLITKKYYSYMTGAIYETNLSVSGMQNEYVEFRKNFISKLLAEKYFSNAQSEHEYTEKNGMLFCKENVLNEFQYYILIKKDNKIYSTKIYSKNADETLILTSVKNKIEQFK